MDLTTAPLAAVTGIGPVGYDGVGIAELAAAAPAPIPPAAEFTVRQLATFDPAQHLGRRGWRFLPPATRAALAAAKLALADAGAPAGGRVQTGVVIGTNFAVSEIADRIDAALLGGGITDISPMECPNFAVNVPASQVSISGQLRAFNITVVDLLTAGVESVWLGARALCAGRAGAVLAGAIEGEPPRHAAPVLGTTADASAACLLYLERWPEAVARGARVYAYLMGGASRTLPADPAAAGAAVSAALEQVAGGVPARVHLCLPAGGPGADLGGPVRSRLDPQTHLTVERGSPQASATSLLRLARLLTAPDTFAGDCDLILGVAGPHGQFVLLRFRPESLAGTTGRTLANQVMGPAHQVMGLANQVMGEVPQ